MLRDLFPAKVRPELELTAEEVFSREVFRNFSYPLRDWTPFLEVMNKQHQLPTVQQAQQIYNNRLFDTENAYFEKKIDASTASRRVQGALAFFSVESGLKETFEQFFVDRVQEKD